MNLKEQVQSDLKEAMKARDEIKLRTLRMLSAALLNKEKETGGDVTEEEAQDIVNSEAKKRREAIEAYQKGGREELAQGEQEELDVLLQYLPEQLSEEEISKLVEDAISQTGATSLQDIGKVMGVLSSQIKGKADGSVVSSIVKEKLSGS